MSIEQNREIATDTAATSSAELLAKRETLPVDEGMKDTTKDRTKAVPQDVYELGEAIAQETIDKPRVESLLNQVKSYRRSFDLLFGKEEMKIIISAAEDRLAGKPSIISEQIEPDDGGSQSWDSHYGDFIADDDQRVDGVLVTGGPGALTTNNPGVAHVWRSDVDEEAKKMIDAQPLSLLEYRGWAVKELKDQPWGTLRIGGHDRKLYILEGELQETVTLRGGNFEMQLQKGEQKTQPLPDLSADRFPVQYGQFMSTKWIDTTLYIHCNGDIVGRIELALPTKEEPAPDSKKDPDAFEKLL